MSIQDLTFYTLTFCLQHLYAQFIASSLPSKIINTLFRTFETIIKIDFKPSSLTFLDQYPQNFLILYNIQPNEKRLYL